MSNILSNDYVGSKQHKNYYFKYLTSKEFREYKKDNDGTKVIGTIKLKEVNDQKLAETETYMVTKTKDEYKNVYFKINKPTIGISRKYISVGNGKFISYGGLSIKRFMLMIILVLAICLIATYDRTKCGGAVELEDFLPIDLGSDASDGDIRYYDFQTQGSYTVSEESPYIKVWNPETNSRVFQYDIYVDGELFYQTKGISPGGMFEVDCSSLLGASGEYDLVLNLAVLDESTNEVVGQAERDAVLTVE